MKNYLQKPTADRQNFNRFTTPPEQIDDIHKRLPENDSMDQATLNKALSKANYKIIGEGEDSNPGTVTGSAVFKTAAFDHLPSFLDSLKK